MGAHLHAAPSAAELEAHSNQGKVLKAYLKYVPRALELWPALAPKGKKSYTRAGGGDPSKMGRVAFVAELIGDFLPASPIGQSVGRAGPLAGSASSASARAAPSCAPPLRPPPPPLVPAGATTRDGILMRASSVTRAPQPEVAGQAKSHNWKWIKHKL